MGTLDELLDRSVLFSFDRTGFLRHSRSFEPRDLDRTMRGKACVVTGANSGLGFEVARGLAVRDASVHLLCRNEARGAEARRRIAAEAPGAELHLHVVDVSRPDSIRRFAETLVAPRVDVLVHNAGLLPAERVLTPEGLELTVATHLVGPFLLTRLLAPRLAGGRVVFVTSGGMYTKRLDVDAMLSTRGRYDGVAAYAMTKRGQVVLSELLAAELAPIGATVNAMHPGWAATPGVERSLPRFWKVMRKRLRTPAEGADTALWLAVAADVEGVTGKLWFDRRPVPTHLLRRTREPPSERQRLLALCERHVDGPAAPVAPAPAGSQREL